MARRPSLGVPLAYLAICVIWGSTYLAIKVGLESFAPFFFAGVRYAIATVLGLAILRMRGIPLVGPARRWLPAVAIGVLLVGICNGLVFWSETRLDSGYTALLISSSPVWTALLTPFAKGERRVGALSWIGIAIGFAGTVVLIAPWKASLFALMAAVTAELSVVIWTATSLWVRRIRDRYDPFALTVVQMGAGAVALFLLAAADGRTLVGPVTAASVAALAFLVVFGSLIAFGAYFYLLKHWDASRVATSTYINPIVAVALGAAILSEPIHANMVIGALIVFAGVALVLREERIADLEEEHV